MIFIPASSEKLLKGTGEEVMIAFLEPLMRELEFVFIEGFEVLYDFLLELIFEGLSPLSGIGDSKLRAMLMYWTGDHPAQTKVAGFKTSRYNACRCHYNVVEKVVGTKVIYLDNRRQAYDPPPAREIQTIYLESQDFQFGASSNRSRRNTIITTYSKLWRLYDMYGFDLSLDLVYDSMHILPLNLFKNFVEQLMNEGRAVSVDNSLNELRNHHPQQLGAKWPYDCSNRLGYWRAEEY